MESGGGIKPVWSNQVLVLYSEIEHNSLSERTQDYDANRVINLVIGYIKVNPPAPMAISRGRQNKRQKFFTRCEVQEIMEVNTHDLHM